MKNQKIGLRDKVLSILYDADFVEYFSSLFPNLPVISNKRSGCWLVKPSLCKGDVYFKSTDGHYGKWDLNCRRLNLHLLSIIQKGCIIVDTTKKGKIYPDSLSKTVPIWCCVVNRAIARHRDNWCTSLHVLPNLVSESEKSEIEALLDGFVEKLLSLDVFPAQVLTVEKPLRPLWFSADSYITEDFLPHFDDLDFLPIILLNASSSKTDYTNCFHEGNEFMYVAGASDDAESWLQGCSVAQFWSSIDLFLQCESDHEIIACLKQSTSISMRSLSTCAPTSRIAKTNIFVGDWRAVNKDTYNMFDIVINCTNVTPSFLWKEKQRAHTYFQLNIPEGKQGQATFFNSIQQSLRLFESEKRILIHCKQGIDRSAGIAICFLLSFHSDLTIGKVRSLTKDDVIKTILFMQNYRSCINPSRATIKKITSYYMAAHAKSSIVC